MSATSSNTTRSSLRSVTPAMKAEIPADNETIPIVPIDSDDKGQYSFNKEKSSLYDTTILLDIDDTTTPTIFELPYVPVNNTSNNKIKSTKTQWNSRSALPIILVSIFGGLVMIVLIACIIVYILIKQGYIKISNEPRIRIKGVKQTRIIDSSSTIDDAGPSQR